MTRDYGFTRRALRSARRRARLVLVRLVHPRAKFGSGSDVRGGLRLLIAPGGRVELGAQCVVDHGMTIECRGRLAVGDRTIFGHHCTIGVDDEVTIGPDCLIAEMVAIRDHDHEFGADDRPVREQGSRTAKVVLGSDVWVGGRATITAGVKVGDHAIVAAGAVVTRDVEPWMIVGGVPARVIGERSRRDE